MTSYRKPGLLLVNLGTPDAPRTPEVRRYLRQFLSDPRVIDIPALSRWLLLNLIILPTRPAKSAEAYRKIWTEEGSPLLVYSQALTREVRARLPGFEVELAMRYGNPSIPSGLERLRARGVTEYVVFPLYPQYAASSTASTEDELMRVLREGWDLPPVRVLGSFHDHPGFLDAFAEVARPVLDGAGFDHVLFSYHGLPERQIRKSDPSGNHCLATPACCDAITSANHRCYRAQSYATSRALAQRLRLSDGGWSVSFQSRLGRTPWIKPYTDLVIPELAKKGVRRLAVMVPSFVADCLETLEEIALRGDELFRQAGGEALVLVPSLNAHPTWADAVVQMVTGSGSSASK